MIINQDNQNSSINKYMIGIVMIIINLGARFIIDDLTEKQKEIINNKYTRKLLVFCVFFMATKDFIASLTLTIIFILFISELIEEIYDNNSKEGLYI